MRGMTAEALAEQWLKGDRFIGQTAARIYYAEWRSARTKRALTRLSAKRRLPSGRSACAVRRARATRGRVVVGCCGSASESRNAW